MPQCGAHARTSVGITRQRSIEEIMWHGNRSWAQTCRRRSQRAGAEQEKNRRSRTGPPGHPRILLAQETKSASLNTSASKR